MKRKFIFKVTLFLIPLFLLAIGIEVFARTIPNSYRYKKEWMDSHRDSVKTLILGNSHMYSAIVPSILDHTFSLANSGQTLEYDAWLLMKYIDICPNLSSVIINLDNSNLFSIPYEKNGGAWNRITYYNLYMGCPKYDVFSKYHYELTCPKVVCSKIEKYIRAKIIGENYDIKCDSLGRGTYYSLERQKKRSMQENKLKNLHDRNFHSDGLIFAESNYKQLQSIADICQKHQIRLIVINPPYWHLYNQYENKELFEIVESYAHQLLERYGVEYYNYRQDDKFSNEMDYFADCHHLSDIGAIAFSNTIKNDFFNY